MKRNPHYLVAITHLRKISDLLLVLLIVVSAFLIRISIGTMTWDDAYITFRYARNVADGLGFVYNAGERILGTTTPLFTLLLAGFKHSGLTDLPLVALAINACADGITTFLIFKFVKRIGVFNKFAFVPSLLFAISPLSAGFAASGMESSIFTLLIVSALFAYASKYEYLSMGLAGLAVLTRPEALIAAGCIFLTSWYQHKRLPIKSTAIFLVIVMPWIIFATVYFKSPIPNSILAKVQHYPSSILGNALRIVMDLGVPGFNSLPLQLDTWSFPYDKWPIFSLILLFFSLLSAPRLIRYLKHQQDMIPLALFAPLLIVLLIIEGYKSAHIFPWYYVPLIPFYSLALVLIVHHLTSRFSILFRSMSFGVIILWTVLGINLGRQPEIGFFEAYGVNLAREKAYIAAASFLAPSMNPQIVVALPEIGAFGYYADVIILDTAGLVSPQSISYYPLPTGYTKDITIPPELIQKEQPDYIVVFERFLPIQLRDSSWFLAHYRTSATFQAPIWGSDSVYVYSKLDTGDP